MSAAVISTMRYHYMDAMRSILMLLGVVVHASQVFNPRVKWLFSAAEPLFLAGRVVDVLTIFRMPAFFIVSGFFSLMMLRKYQAQRFLRFRFRRIFLPLLVVALTLNVLQERVLANYRGEIFSWLDYLHAGWLGHLWFLLFLLLYCLVLAIVAKPVAIVFTRFKFFGRIAAVFLHLPLLLQFAIISILTPILIKIMMLIWPFGDQLGELFCFSDMLFYAQFFVVGVGFFNCRQWLERFTLASWWQLALMILLIMWLIQVLPENPQSAVYRLIGKVLYVYQIWLASSLCFQFFYRFCNAGLPVFTYLSDGSYTIYLFHHILVIVIAIQLLGFGWPAAIVWPILMCVVIVLAVAAHEVVRRIPVLRFLFNGK